MSSSSKQPPLLTFRKDICDFIAICERIQGLIAHGEPLSPDEQAIIEMCGADLLSKLKSPAGQS